MDWYRCFVKMGCKIEKIVFLCKIDDKFASTDVDALKVGVP